MSRVRAALAGALGLALALSLAPSGARAYSAGATFARPVLEGGGGGRFFTGSFADGYTCAVCHGDARAEPPTVTGLPADGFVEGETYELEVLWAPGARAGLALEVVDERGVAAGTVALMGAGGVCTDGSDAASLVAPAPVGPSGPRSVLVVDGCGASAVHVLWTAPAAARGSVFLEAAYVRSDRSGGPDGDATAQLEIQVPPLNVPADARLLEGGCATAAAAGDARRSIAVATLAISLGVLLLRRRRRRQRR